MSLRLHPTGIEDGQIPTEKHRKTGRANRERYPYEPRLQDCLSAISCTRFTIRWRTADRAIRVNASASFSPSELEAKTSIEVNEGALPSGM
jgi:hypothetical protein